MSAISSYNPNAIPNRGSNGLSGPQYPQPAQPRGVPGLSASPAPVSDDHSRTLGLAAGGAAMAAGAGAGTLLLAARLRAAQQAPVAPAQAPVVPTQAPVSSMADGVTAAQRLNPTGAPGAPGAPTGLGGLATRARGWLNGGMGKLSMGTAMLGALYDQTKDDSTARYAKRFGVDEPTGDGSLGDMAKFGALRLGGFASDLGNYVSFGQASRLYRDNDIPSATPPVKSAAGGLAAPAPAALPDAATPSTDPMEVNNAERFGLPMATQRDAQAISPVNLRGGFAHENLTTDPAQASANLRASVAGIPAGQAALVAGLDAGTKMYATKGPTGGLTLTGTGDGSANAAYEASDQFKQGLARAATEKAQLAEIEAGKPQGPSVMTIGGAGDPASGLMKRLMARDHITPTGMRAMTEMLQSKQSAADSAERAREADQTNKTSLRGQDVTLAGQQMTAKTAAMQARLNQFNADRTFNLDTQKFASQNEQNDFTQRQAAQKDMTAHFEKQFTTTDAKGNQVVDHAGVARAAQGVQAFLGNRVALLQAQIQQGGPAAQMAAQELKLIQTKGPAALDPKHLNDIAAQTKLADRIKETHSPFTPWGSSFVESSNPDGYRVTGREKNLLGSDTLVTANGSRIRENDTLYNEPGNRILPDAFKTRTTDYNPAKGLKQ